MENFPIPVNFTSIAVGILALVMVIGAARGVVRMFFGLGALVFALIVAYVWYQQMPEVSAGMEAPLSPRVVGYSTLFVGVLAFIVSRWIFGLLAKPFTYRNDGKPRGGGLLGALLGLIPAAGLIYVIAIVLRLVSTSESVAFIGDSVETAEGETKPEPAWMQQIRSVLNSDPLANLIAKIDPFIDRGAAVISELLVSFKDQSSAESMQMDPKLRQVFENPNFKNLLDDPEIQDILQRGDYGALLQNKKVAAAARAPELQTSLDPALIEERVDAALYDENGKRKRPRFRIFRQDE
jgi:uncharacterized membrane protein required for colicin V production